MRLRSVHIKNYKSCLDTVVEPIADLHVLVGPNNEGKSAILEAIRLLPLVGENQPVEHLQRRVTGQDEQAVVEVAFGFEVLPEERARYFADMLDALGDTRVPEALRDTEFFTRIGCTLAAQAGGGRWLPGETVHLTRAWVAGADGGELWTYRLWSPEEDPPDARGARRARTNWLHELADRKGDTGGAFLGGWEEADREQFARNLRKDDFATAHRWWTEVKLFAERIAYFSQDRAVSPTAEMQDSDEYSEDGANVGGVLHYLHNVRPSDRQEIEQTLRALSLPSLRDVTFEPSGRTVTPVLNFTDMGVQLRFDEVGAGIPHTLVLVLGVILAPDGGLCLVEEPELHIHPDVQGRVLAFLEEQSRSKQIIVTTHSPAIAGRVQTSAVHLISRDKNGTNARYGGEQGTAQAIAGALGVRPHDEIAGYRAMVFVEGASDAPVVQRFSKTLRDSDHIDADLDEARVALVIGGGVTNLKFAASAAFCRRMRRPIWVVLDRHANPGGPPSKQVQETEAAAKAAGAKVHVWEKRSIENYFHPDAVHDAIGVRVEIDGGDCAPEKLTSAIQQAPGGRQKYDKVRDAPGIAAKMTAERILERDAYSQDGQERHEILDLLKEIIEAAQGRHEEDE